MATEIYDSVTFKVKRDAGIEKCELWQASVYEVIQSYKSGDADLRYADLSYANLSDANLSGTKGILSPVDYMDKTFETNELGYIVYKTFNSQYLSPDSWVFEPNSIISEVPNPLPTLDCACGVNVATLEWVKREQSGEIWKCLIEWKWLVGVIVPYNTDGKIRCERIRLLEIVK